VLSVFALDDEDTEPFVEDILPESLFSYIFDDGRIQTPHFSPTIT
jgi:hypothetical protein